MTNHYLPVLIVGAGPTGLMMACELERHNIPFRIIDKKSSPTQGSNATWIQTRTLEILDLIGIADRFLKIGHRCGAINLYENSKHLVSIPFDSIDSDYPFILMLPQSETERLLQARLAESHIRIERSVELIDIKQTNNTVISIVRLANGDTENITSHWVIACDGANSTIREKCQIPFPGEDIQEQFMVADATMRSFLPTNEIHVFFEKGTIFSEKGTLFSAFPWNTKDYRLSANLYSSHPRQFFTEQEVKELVAERTYGNYIVEKVSWISPFWIHSKIVNQMREQSIFLVGDAAHTHSPVGGQGMNSGLQDAFNLAWKLALIIQNKAKPALLDSFPLERHSIVSHVVKETEYLTKMMLFDKSFFTKLRKFCKNAAKPKIAHSLSMELAQLNIQYNESPIIDYHEKPPTGAPKQGERALDVKISNTARLFHYFQNTKHQILLFTGIHCTEKNLKKLEQLQQWLDENYADEINTYLITTEEASQANNIISDKNNIIHTRYHLKTSAIYIIRPDNYIAYFSKKPNEDTLKAFLNEYLIYHG
ncbi:MAG: FAD-dependent monooxygenase [Gammaproteobacteria bacterium]|nr:FAD-dependent monooxygenase [Gammaproteobacteria bacterium]